jgi:acid stress-induced BolA-like protein IbaG/YrbA
MSNVLSLWVFQVAGLTQDHAERKIQVVYYYYSRYSLMLQFDLTCQNLHVFGDTASLSLRAFTRKLTTKANIKQNATVASALVLIVLKSCKHTQDSRMRMRHHGKQTRSFS